MAVVLALTLAAAAAAASIHRWSITHLTIGEHDLLVQTLDDDGTRRILFDLSKLRFEELMLFGCGGQDFDEQDGVDGIHALGRGESPLLCAILRHG